MKDQVSTPTYFYGTKFSLLADILQGEKGTLLDLGARNKILKPYLNLDNIKYTSHDIIDGHDFQFDLEQPIPIDDQVFDIVVALDVLEHLEKIHETFFEMMRITNRLLLVSLPCMDSLQVRLHYLRTGQLGAKYSLLPEHQGDRHRWVTTYEESVQMIITNAHRNNFRVTHIYNHPYSLPIIKYKRFLPSLNDIFPQTATFFGGIFTETITFVIERT